MTEDGKRLDAWLNNMRTRYAALPPEEQRETIRERIIGMAWSVTEANWMQYYTAAKAYYVNNGDLKVAKRYVTGDGLKLRVQLSNQRSLYRKNRKQNGRLNPKRIQMLTNIGMTW